MKSTEYWKGKIELEITLERAARAQIRTKD